MDDAELKQRLEAIEAKLDATYRSAEKTRKFILAMLIGSVALLVLPFIGLLFEIPTFMSVYSQYSQLSGL